ncbi:hypothetical protein QCB45_04855 [Thiomicrorhabdus sp. ZW0627]|uniref:hypothetical protein n=1 Tax=Thiomicrorhabdus sp. ZW0627 TaxID=3039774 RepID=UPI0024370004|nr:hypothetical protein [Thiomicrorhabdus sp. ZW0627]MDG6773652.1 hypothetical protein [Thiomicrorhabdus sp. ZW0627]
MKTFFTLIVSALLLAPLPGKAGEVLPLAVDLQKTGKVAEKFQVPVVIFYTATWCNYCKMLEENIITPLLETTPIEEYAQFQQVLLDKEHWMMKDFAGNDVEMKTFGPSQGIVVAPTTHFYNSKGEQIAEPIIGLTLEEHYPANLEKRINEALEKLGNKKRLDIYKLVEESDGI